ncbi:MAG: DUF4286 family protein [Flavobacteriaceae bacterium]|nr:DUF4286 family protein [Flavobacteriaceae bacterium]
MTLLSITFHTDEHRIEEWENFVENELIHEINKFNTKYMLSEVDSEMLSEGKNTNLLLFFENQNEINDFIEKTFSKVSQKILEQFQESVLIFKTLLKNVKTNIE